VCPPGAPVWPRALLALALSSTLASALSGAPAAVNEAAEKLFRDGKRAEKKGDLARAYGLYTQAAALDPDNPEYAGRSIGLRSKTLGQAKAVPAPEAPAQPESAGPVPFPEIRVDAAISEKDLEDVQRLLPPPTLAPVAKRVTLKLNAPPRQLFEQTLGALGYDFVFDGDYPQAAPNARLEIDDHGYREAIYALEVLTGSFVVPLGPKLLLIVKDTPTKRQEQERYVAVMVPLPEPFTAQDAQELARSVQQIMEIQKFAVDATRRAAYLRGPASKVMPALALFQQMMTARAQVMIEVELYELNHSRSSSWGLDIPSMFNLRNFSELVSGSAGAALSQVWKFMGSTGFYGVGIGNAKLVASMTYNSAQTLLKSEVRTLDNLPAQFHVGDKYPILTGRFGNSSLVGGIQSPPTVQFEDLGLTLKVTPRIHSLEDVTLDLESEFKLLTGQAANGIPVIANRKFTGKVRLRMGEWAVVAGLVTDSTTTSLNGIPVLRDVPGLGVRSKETRKGDTLLVIRPRILTVPPGEAPAPTIWVGTEARLRTPL